MQLDQGAQLGLRSLGHQRGPDGFRLARHRVEPEVRLHQRLEVGALFLGHLGQGLALDRFPLGTPEYPDRAVTLIVEVAALAPANALLSGPGIATVQEARLPEIDAFAANRARFPLGFDCYFCAGAEIAALPRSSQVEAL